MFFGVTFEKIVVLAVIAALLVGPERLPEFARMLTQLVRRGKELAARSTERVRTELGPEFDDVDWRKLDPRQYDPRRIVREALLDPVSTFEPLPPPPAAEEPDPQPAPRPLAPAPDPLDAGPRPRLP